MDFSTTIRELQGPTPPLASTMEVRYVQRNSSRSRVVT